MPRSARPAAAVSIKEWVMPAPAPWANTKQARALFGAASSAETEVDLPTSMTRFLAPVSFMARASPAREESATHTGDYVPRRINTLPMDAGRAASAHRQIAG